MMIGLFRGGVAANEAEAGIFDGARRLKAAREALTAALGWRLVRRGRGDAALMSGLDDRMLRDMGLDGGREELGRYRPRPRDD